MNGKNLNFFDEIRNIDTQIGLPKLYRHLAILKRLSNSVTGSGFSMYEEKSLLAAMGEAVERYCASIKQEKSYWLNNSNGDDYKLEKINIDDITRASKLNDQVAEREWVKVREMFSQNELLIPSEMVYLEPTKYPPIRDIISTGLAAVYGKIKVHNNAA